MTDRSALVGRLRKAQVAIYAAIDEGPARDISALFAEAAALIESPPAGEIQGLVERLLHLADPENEDWTCAVANAMLLEAAEAITRLSQPSGERERIVRAAIKWGEAVYSVAPPGRHGDVFRVIEADPVADISCDGGPDAQGFLTSTGRFLGRIGARQCARDAGQLLPTASKSDDLFSEDLW